MLLVLSSVGAQAQQVSYPLHTGDQWEYASSVPNAPRKVASDTTMPNGKTYRTILSQGFNPGYPTFWWQYHRQENNRVFSFETSLQQEILLFDFDGNVGDTISVYSRGLGVGRVILQVKGMDTFFGVSRRHWTFLHDPSSSVIDEEIRVEVTDTLGITGYINMNGPWSRITGAIIDGKSYGTLAGIPEAPALTRASVQLDLPFPNPFNSSTVIRYALAKRSNVNLTVYNTLGQQVTELIIGEVEAGSHDVKLDAASLPSGVYLYRLQAGSHVETKKLLVLR
jgi:hypothetical protein